MLRARGATTTKTSDELHADQHPCKSVEHYAGETFRPLEKVGGTFRLPTRLLAHWTLRAETFTIEASESLVPMSLPSVGASGTDKVRDTQ